MNAKLFVFLLMLPFIVYAGGKGFLHHEVRQGLDKIQEQGAPFFEMKYGRVVSSLNGSVGVKDLSIKPHQFSEPMKLGELGIDTPNLWFLMKLKDHKKLLRDGWPKSLAVYVRDIEIDLSSGSFREFISSMSPAAAIGSSDQRITTDNHPCFDGNEDPLQIFKKIGVEKLLIDARYGYEQLEPSENIDLQLKLNIDGLYRLDANMVLQNRGKINFQSMSSPMLIKGKVSYQDNGVSKRVIDICAEKLNQSKEAAAETLVNYELDGTEQLGIVFDQPLIDAYRDAFFNGKTFVVTANPFEPQNLSHIKQYDAEDIPDLLNLKAYAE